MEENQSRLQPWFAETADQLTLREIIIKGRDGKNDRL